ncbi:hypothetical protein EV198_0115 [Roseivirga ehrenbergii]|uniref:Uncharacterized protein n=1 Tax=Roseivirga ehrenbergii (strain DSM 102268 / JCM 13514 / KCTC 12282 / NCIMB 14502 / KMM 6017) TaxID=279360 RepID=A0A150X007_ROSEK|nr:hypothetical protein [Roseivirga ehrenbergii]KYG72069.1 hypothetical protein MB14_08420 [Roseivirga ehrenbergii]TCL13293.1 hypothetical protein EV198_0115 [Roseivirga ehrenbergii]
MKNLRLGYFLAIGILVLNVWGYPYAQLNQDSATCSELLSESTEVIPLVAQDHQFFLSEAPLSDSEKTFNVDVVETEIEEELTSSKKHLAGSTYMAAIICLLLLGFFSSRRVKKATFTQRFSYLTSRHWYIVYQVFRI